jgi:hypothetical protein
MELHSYVSHAAIPSTSAKCRSPLNRSRPNTCFLFILQLPTHLKHLRYEGVTKSFRTGRRERVLQMVQLSATRCSSIAIL